MRTVLRTLTGTLFYMATAISGYGQSEEALVKQAVDRLFEAMLNADSAGVVNAFMPEGKLQTIAVSPDGKVSVRNQSITAFGGSVGSRKPGELEEKIAFGAIHIDGALASVWTPYEFFVEKKKSHAGVNSFQLVKSDGIWKIQYIIDTRRK